MARSSSNTKRYLDNIMNKDFNEINRKNYLNGFISTDNTTYGIKRNVGLLFNNKFDEPTYIAIRVDFFPDVIDKTNLHFTGYTTLFNNGSVKSQSYNDMPTPLLDRGEESLYSTYKYLKDSIGDIYRASLLDKLISGLQDLTLLCPYYITSIEGIDKLFNIDPKRGSRIKSDNIITLKCIEGLDQRISALKNLYKKIAWDDTYQRWILPDIMRYFKMNIYISEFRIFHTYKSDDFVESRLKIYDNNQTIADIDNNTNYTQQLTKKQQRQAKRAKRLANKTQKNILNNKNENDQQNINNIVNDVIENVEFENYINYNFVNNRMPTMVLSCNMCEFDISDSFNHLSNLTSSPKDPLNDLEIKIKVGNMIEHSTYGLFGVEVDDKHEMSYNKFINIDDKMLSFRKNKFTDIENFNDTIKGELKKSIIRECEVNNYLRGCLDIKYSSMDDQENKRSQLYVDTGYINDTLNDPKQKSYVSRLLNNTAKQALNWVKGEVKDEITKLVNKDIIAGSSLLDIRNAIRSENLFTMFNIFKSNAEAIKSIYPEISAATNNDISVELFEGYLETLSQATNNTNSYMQDLAKNLLDYGKSINATSIDDYMNVIKTAINDVPLSKATTETNKNNVLL